MDPLTRWPARVGWLILLAIASWSCRRCDEGGAGSDAYAGDAALPHVPVPAGRDAASDVGAEADAPIPDADALEDAGVAPSAVLANVGDAGSSACRLAYGPAEQTFRGPGVLVADKGELHVIANEGGRPRDFPIALGPVPARGVVVKPQKPTRFVAMHWPACAVAGPYAFCSKRGGDVQRTTLGANDTKVVAKHRSGTRVSAALIGGAHTVLVTLDGRRTTEGETLQAFVTLDDGETVRLSDEGAGATVAHVMARGTEAVAVYLDARMAMSPLHARELVVQDKELSLGPDAVLFVGGSPESHIDFALAPTGRDLFALLPHAREAAEFGMAAVPISHPPKDDVEAVWSMYPNGLDPAPVAGASARSDATLGFVARVRPEARAPSSPKVLELGHIDKAGVFSSLGIVANADRVTDLSMVVDRFGAVWLLYGDNTSTWLERRVCP